MSKTYTINGRHISVSRAKAPASYGLKDYFASTDIVDIASGTTLIGWGRSPKDAVNEALRFMGMDSIDELPDEKSFTKRKYAFLSIGRVW